MEVKLEGRRSSHHPACVFQPVEVYWAVLSNTVDAMVVPADLYYGNLQYNTKYLTDEELDIFVYDPKVDVHVNIITDDEGVVVVE